MLTSEQLAKDIEATLAFYDGMTEAIPEPITGCLDAAALLVDRPLVLAALQAGAEERRPDIKAAYAERDHQIGPALDDVGVQMIVKAAIEDAETGLRVVVLDVPDDALLVPGDGSE